MFRVRLYIDTVYPLLFLIYRSVLTVVLKEAISNLVWNSCLLRTELTLCAKTHQRSSAFIIHFLWFNVVALLVQFLMRDMRMSSSKVRHKSKHWCETWRKDMGGAVRGWWSVYMSGSRGETVFVPWDCCDWTQSHCQEECCEKSWGRAVSCDLPCLFNNPSHWLLLQAGEMAADRFLVFLFLLSVSHQWWKSQWWRCGIISISIFFSRCRNCWDRWFPFDVKSDDDQLVLMIQVSTKPALPAGFNQKQTVCDPLTDGDMQTQLRGLITLKAELKSANRIKQGFFRSPEAGEHRMCDSDKWCHDCGLGRVLKMSVSTGDDWSVQCLCMSVSWRVWICSGFVGILSLSPLPHISMVVIVILPPLWGLQCTVWKNY